jgi:hypothetical protein
MCGAMCLSPIETAGLSLRELVIRYDAFLLDRWDHTSSIVAQLANVISTVNNLVATQKIKPKGMMDVHPYRKRPRRGMAVGNISDLKMIGSLMAARRRK